MKGGLVRRINVSINGKIGLNATGSFSKHFNDGI